MTGGVARSTAAAPSDASKLSQLLPTPGVLATLLVFVAGAWGLTLVTARDFQVLMMAQPMGVSLVDTLWFGALSAVMMTAMMLPTAVPMVAAYGRAERDRAGAGASATHTTLFCLSYIALWAAMTALSLVALTALGLLGAMGGAALSAPGAVLVAAGVYQFTAWKAYCLRHCRTPLGYLTTHYRSGAGGALRMGLEHGLYCLGCCWLLMLVWLVAASMSALWMGVFAVLILAEKAADRDGLVSRTMGAVSAAVGSYALLTAWAQPPM